MSKLPKSMSFASFAHFIASISERVTVRPVERFFATFNTKNSLNKITIVRTGFNDVVKLERIFMSSISDYFVAHMEAVDPKTGQNTEKLIDFYNQLYKEQLAIFGEEGTELSKSEAFARCFETYEFATMAECFTFIVDNIFKYISEEPVDIFLKASNPYANDVRFRCGYKFDHTKTIEEQIADYTVRKVMG